MTDRDELFSVLNGLADAFNDHDVNRIMSYFADDCSLDLPRGKEPYGSRNIGSAEVRKGIMTRFETTPDVHYDEMEHFVDGDTGMSKWLLTGTTPDGIRISVRVCDFYTFRAGKVVRKDSYWKIVDR